MKLVITMVLVGVLGILLPAKTCCAVGDATTSADWLARMSADIPVEWPTIESGLEQLAGRYREDKLVWNGEKNDRKMTEEHWFYDYWINNDAGGAKYHRTRVDNKYARSVFAVAPSHQFRLYAIDKQGLYTLGEFDGPHLHPGWASLDNLVLDKCYDNMQLTPILSGESVFGFKLSWIVQGRRGSVVSCVPMTRDGRQMLRVELKLPQVVFDHGLRGMQDLPATVILDPANHYAIMEIWMTGGDGTAHATCTYRSDVGGLPFPRRVETELYSVFGMCDVKRVLRFDRPTRCDAPAEEFTLAAYGVPEPGSATPTVRRNRLVVWNGLGFLLLGLILLVASYWRRRRRAVA